jgi:Uma2 family endonuclease
MPTTTDNPTTPREPARYGRVTPQAYLVRERAAEYNSHAEPPRISLDEYLLAEETAEIRGEFVDGVVISMTGGTLDHGVIVQNVGSELRDRLRRGPCRVVSQTTHVRIERTERIFYPDVVVYCGAVQRERRVRDLLLNPTVLVEVLSPSTASYDRGFKWENYRRIPSLRDYLLVSQDEPRVERYTRHEDGMWLFSETVGLDATIHLESIGVDLALRDIYEDTLLDGAPPPELQAEHVPEGRRMGIAISKRTEEMRLLTRDEYEALEEVSEARWEFYGLRVDPVTGEPDAAALADFGFTPGGPTVIPGDAVEVEPGMFRMIEGDAAEAPRHWFERDKENG